MIIIQDQIILKRNLYKSNGQQVNKSYKILKCRSKSQSIQIYDVYDPEFSQQLTMKVMIKSKLLSKQKAINQIKNQQMFIGKPNFISLYQIYEDTQNIYLIMQKWGTTLGDLVNERNFLTQYQAQLIFSQILDIIVELRTKNIAHNYISLDSLYINLQQKHKLKLGDFKKSFNIASYFQNLGVQNGTKTNYQYDSQKIQRRIRQNNPYNMSDNLKQNNLNQKIAYYSSPQQIQKRSYHNDYNKYLNNLYQNDIWSIGIILYRVLIGRFPFDDQNQYYLQGNHNLQLQTNKTQMRQRIKRQCCFSFYEKTNIYNQNISSQFKELIKSILKPVDRRIKLKTLLNHPLKLHTYSNVHNINFTSELPPLLNLNVPLFKQLKPVKDYLLESFIILKQNHQSFQSQYQFMKGVSSHHQSIRKKSDQQQFVAKKMQKYQLLEQSDINIPSMNYYGSSINYSTFSIFGSDQKQNILKSRAHIDNKQKYQYCWNLNFQSQNQTPQLVFSQSQQGKSTKKTNTIQNYALESQQSNKIQSSQFDDVKKVEKSAKKANVNNSTFKRQPFKSVYNSSSIIDNLFMLSRNQSQNQNQDSNQNNLKNTHSKKNPNSNLLSQNQNITNSNQSSQNSNFSRKIQKINKGFSIKSYNNSRHVSGKNSGNANLYKQSKNNHKKYPNEDEIYQEQMKFLPTDSLFYSSLQSKGIGQRQQAALDPQTLKKNQQIKCQLKILNNYLSNFPLLVTQPEFVLQYKYQKQNNSLGYVLNNGVGVIFQNGKQIMGHNQNDFVSIPKVENSQLKFSTFHVQKIDRNISLFKSYSEKQMKIYNQYLKIFGKRMVISNFSIWIQKYWRKGKVFIFLLNNGSWQVTFQGKKTSKFFIIDENQLVWAKGKIHSDMINVVRDIVNQKKSQILKQRFFYK